MAYEQFAVEGQVYYITRVAFDSGGKYLKS
jgi:hypothetical protein